MESVLSGMRPTGRLHLGHLEGVLKNYVEMQDKYKAFYMVADWHALTTDYEKPKNITENTMEMYIDWLSVGIDPKKAVMFVQSAVKEHAELFLLLSMITPVPWLERNPTYKEQKQELKEKDLSTFGFLGYPVLQAADILVYRANKVPIGEDQRPHLELAREIVRRFNNYYGEFFPEPKEILTMYPKLPGLDGRKMSKSYNNAIYLADSAEETEKKVKMMFTDPLKVKKNDLGHPEECVVCAFHKIYNGEGIDTVEKECREGTRGCVDCKKQLTVFLNARMAPIRETRAQFENKPDLIRDIIKDGNARAAAAAVETMAGVRHCMKLG
ncbi:MAG: tryptophan--tRNA ligase [Candidatus Goldiibacteriota bacterium HGW-Goldbacteria-1]|jgi:tryptophanyl-tRNA synthetase|nr:MAG: tryptophan--tRNA ligase [Candidatus Goldiibacteriota bacterium HGW-Goldbacteria-1]